PRSASLNTCRCAMWTTPRPRGRRAIRRGCEEILMPEQQKHSFSTGDIVATRRTLINKRSILAGPLLWADSLGVVLATSPLANIVLAHFGSVGAVWLRPEDVELAGVS